MRNQKISENISEKIVFGSRVDSLSVFRRNLVQGNHEDFLNSVQKDEYIEPHKEGDVPFSEADFNEASRKLYNLLSSYKAWREKAEDLWEDKGIEIEEELTEHIEPRKLYFLQELRNYLNHKGEIHCMFAINDEELRVQIGKNATLNLDFQERAGAGSKIEQGFEYYKEQRYKMDLKEDISELIEAVKEVDQKLSRKSSEY